MDTAHDDAFEREHEKIPLSREFVTDIVSYPLLAPQSPLVLRALSNADASSTRIVRNAQRMLDAFAEGPQPLTKKLGQLNRRFVRRMSQELEFDPEFSRRYLRRDSFDEEQVWPLSALRHVLRIAGLIRTLHGKALITKTGEQLRSPERASELYALLLATYFTKYNIASTDAYSEDDTMQQHVAFALFRMGVQLRVPQPLAEFADRLPHDEAVWADGGILAEFGINPDWQLHGALTRRVLEPLIDFGLLSRELPAEHESPRRRIDRETDAQWSLTPLFDRLVALRVEDRLVDLGSVEPPRPIRRREPVPREQWMTVAESIECFSRDVAPGDPQAQAIVTGRLMVFELASGSPAYTMPGDTKSPVERAIRSIPSTLKLAQRAWKDAPSDGLEVFVTILSLYVSWCIDEGQAPEEVGAQMLELLQPHLPADVVVYGDPSMN